ncbi:MAG: hypothetical protein N3A69_01695 [Leptospiraceae bacterium]|nr:hypothetical protein [Leptospiraceae bacterium]
MTAIELSKEYQELLTRFNALSQEFATLLEEEENLLLHEKPVLIAKYNLTIGGYVLKYLEKQLEYLKLRRKIELLQSHINRGEVLDLASVEVAVAGEFQDWMDRISNLNQEILEAQEGGFVAIRQDVALEVKNLYKKLARKLHPDLNKNLTEKGKLLWNRLQRAYENFDLEEMKNIEILADSENLIEEQSSMEELKTQIEKLWEKVLKKQEQLQTIRESFPFSIARQLNDPNWVNQEIESYQVKIKEIEIILPEYEQVYQSLLNGTYGKRNEHPENL